MDFCVFGGGEERCAVFTHALALTLLLAPLVVIRAGLRRIRRRKWEIEECFDAISGEVRGSQAIIAVVSPRMARCRER